MAKADICDDGHGELRYVFHLVFDELLHLVGLFGDDVEEQFVVDLERHAGTQLTGGDLTVERDHGELDEVGGGALQRRVDGGALSEAAHVRVARAYVRDGADTAEVGAYGLIAADCFQRLVDEAADAGVTVKVGFDVGLGNLLVNVELNG